MSKFRNKLFWALFSAVLVLALVLRVYQIGARPLHSDEGVNSFFLENMEPTGVYPYSHENYHGPAYFWLSYGAVQLLGMNVPGLRAVSLLCGMLLLFVLLHMRKHAGGAFVLVAALLVAVSPSMVFHSRYGIHEMLFLCSSTWFALLLYVFLEQKRASLIYLLSLALALMVASKETFIITLFCLGLSVLALRNYRRNLALVMEKKKHFVNATLLFVVLTSLVYSSGFRSFQGIREMFLSVPQWVGRGTTSDPGHFKRFAYYLIDVINVTEPGLPLLFALAGALFLLRLVLSPKTAVQAVLSDRFRPALYFFVWSLSMFLVYSAVPYKTPWLLINITLPALLFAAWCLAAMIESGEWRRLAGAAVLCAFVLAETWATIRFNYADGTIPFTAIKATGVPQPYGSGNPFCYVHTSPAIWKLADDVARYWRDNPEARVLVGCKAYWPLPFYLRDKAKQLSYFIPDEFPVHARVFGVIITDQSNPWPEAPWPAEYYRLSDITDALVYFRPPHWSPPGE